MLTDTVRPHEFSKLLLVATQFFCVSADRFQIQIGVAVEETETPPGRTAILKISSLPSVTTHDIASRSISTPVLSEREALYYGMLDNKLKGSTSTTEVMRREIIGGAAVVSFRIPISHLHFPGAYSAGMTADGLAEFDSEAQRNLREKEAWLLDPTRLATLSTSERSQLMESWRRAASDRLAERRSVAKKREDLLETLAHQLDKYLVEQLDKDNFLESSRGPSISKANSNDRQKTGGLPWRISKDGG
ncbi:unnamed protein product [Amoebophrya sp. A120]|nr:unnamed protein product [Amoebophrya sp. A120]|eukprot:GSA120T00007496001.1